MRTSTDHWSTQVTLPDKKVRTINQHRVLFTCIIVESCSTVQCGTQAESHVHKYTGKQSRPPSFVRKKGCQMAPWEVVSQYEGG